MKQQAGFLIGIGSNIEPHNNIIAIIEQLLEFFPRIILSRVLQLPPIGMNSQNDFLNVVAFIETTLSKDELKEIFNAIETKQGRDRSDPARNTKDRPADLDILTTVHYPHDYAIPTNEITDEYFLYPLIEELVATISGKPILLKQKGVALKRGSLAFGQTATTINRQTDSGNKRVI